MGEIAQFERLGRFAQIRLVADTSCVDDERPPICPACGVTMVPSALSAAETHSTDWICVECEENGEPDAG